ncbi:MAG TPA: RidA family protein [Fibrobacteraceae bacterium]|nr:RidA family protein [Fibrobacteraceae bacterium]
MDLEKRLRELRLEPPLVTPPLAAYVPATFCGDLIHVSGQLPLRKGALLFQGSVPDAVTVEQAQLAARQCFLNGLAAAASVAGGWDYLRRLVQMNGFVQCGAGFTGQPQVINGASELALELMGDAGRHARVAVGVSSLPMAAPVEISFVFQSISAVG